LRVQKVGGASPIGLLDRYKPMTFEVVGS